MEHKIINTGQYLLIVDDTEIKEGDWVLYNMKGKQWVGKMGGKYIVTDWCKKIIAHLPLNNSPILEGVDLLPTFEDDVEKLADEIVGDSIYYEEDRVNLSDGMDLFMIGYNKAKEKYKYTEQDIINAIQYGIDIEAGNIKFDYKKYPDSFTQYFDSLQQPKMPVGFLEKGSYNGTWVGEYIY